MLSSHLKIAVRNLLKQKGLTVINILGLSIGLACFSLFLLYATNEFSYDRFHAAADQIYRVYRWSENIGGRGVEGDAYLPMPLGPAMREHFPEVENYVRWFDHSEDFVRVDRQVNRLGISFADPQALDVFSFPLLYGDRQSALRDINSVVLTERTARQLFGAANPVGRTLEIRLEEAFEPFTVTAVAENPPANSSIQFNLLINFERLAAGSEDREDWRSSAYLTFVKLRENSGLPNDEDRLLAFRQTYYPDEADQLREAGLWEGEGAPITYRLQALRDMHTNTLVDGGAVPAVEARNIWILLAIAAGVLLIAIINFTTLAIGRSAGRAKEVGVRKVIGSSRRALVVQFLAESMLLSVISISIALGLTRLLLPYFNELADRSLTFSFDQYPELAWMTVGLAILVGLLAGSYPALVMSSFQPLKVLRQNFRLSGSNFFTKSLVTFQFVVSIGLIASTLLILRQIDFMQAKNPGFDKENLLVIDATDLDSRAVYQRLRQSLANHPKVVGITSADLGLGAGNFFRRSHIPYRGEIKDVYEYLVDDDYLTVMGMELLAGRDFDPARQDSANLSIIINESMMHAFSWTPQSAIGQQLTGYRFGGSELSPRVVGVVKNFHFQSLEAEVEPQLFQQFKGRAPQRFFIRLQAGDPAPVLADLQNVWQRIEPVLPFRYSFLDEDLSRFYESERRFSGILSWAGGISIFLACLGLFGLVALAVANRTKEIGIRKVLGASVVGIVGLLSKDFLRLVGLAVLVASPLAWYFMNQWLNDFAYRIDIPWWTFPLVGLAALAIALLTISIQSLRAAFSKPVRALRTE